jgi:pimeloyl-ACP methyl ester carboxylesterase
MPNAMVEIPSCRLAVESSTVLSTDCSPIFFATKGSGDPTIVFVHCWTCNHTFWQHQIDYFSKRHKVVWLDLAGHGRSGTTRSDYTMEAFGEDVATIVKKSVQNESFWLATLWEVLFQ